MKARTSVLVTLVWLTLPGPLMAQSTMDLSLPDFLKLQQGSQKHAGAQVDVGSVAMDSPVDPLEYQVGPGDRYVLNIWSSSPQEYTLTVSPEGFLIIPTVGRVNVADKTLDSVRREVMPIVQKKYPSAELSLTLLASRTISVQISGQVLNEGKLEMNSVHRVDQLMSVANSLPTSQLTRQHYVYDVPRLRREASERHISVRRRDGTVRRVDLIKYALTGRGEYNPHLREGDMVHVPLRRVRDNNVAVLGGFVRPISLEFAEGDSLTDLILMGYALKPLADPCRAILARETLQGGLDTLLVDLEAVVEGRSPNLALQPGDRLFVPEEPDQRAGDYVVVEGEVLRPGRYPISTHGTTLRQIIAQCGGFTPQASPGAASLLRGRPEELDIPEEARLEELSSARTTFEEADSGYYALETALRLKGETVSVDFRRLFLEGDSTADVTLRNRDRLRVPRLKRTVYVFGQVLVPGHIEHEPGGGVEFYVERAGGYTADARSEDTRVIKAGSRTWLKPGETEVDDGDFIWVPKEYYRPFGFYLTTAAQVSVILGAVATWVILAVTLK